MSKIEDKDTLRGQPFIAEIQKYDNPQDLACGQSVERKCDFCFYRAYVGNEDDDCHIVDDLAKKFFDLPQDKFLPKQLEGKELGNYCKHFVDYRAE